LTNAAKARLRGGEIETAIRATNFLTLTGSLSYTQSKYKKFIDFTGDRSDEPFPTPAWQGSIGAVATVPTAIGEVTGSIDYYRQSKTNVVGQAIFDDRVTQKAYGLLNARVGVELDNGINIAAFARNITKTYYFSAAIALDRTLGFDTVQRGGERR
jgi:iron complex outermembrane receptor protein